MPSDYIELEKRVDALKTVHQKMLQVTYVFMWLQITIKANSSKLTIYQRSLRLPFEPPRVFQ